jgi:hypothetical protein
MRPSLHTFLCLLPSGAALLTAIFTSDAIMWIGLLILALLLFACGLAGIIISAPPSGSDSGDVF